MMMFRAVPVATLFIAIAVPVLLVESLSFPPTTVTDTNKSNGPSATDDDDWRVVGLSCRSNQTHIGWTTTTETAMASDDDSDRSHDDDDDTIEPPDKACLWQTVTDTKRDAYDYLRAHIMAFDQPFLETLGFRRNDDADDNDDGDDDDDSLPDGLADGLIQPTIDLALRAKQAFRYTDDLPKEIWQNYVLNYANLNEARTNIRPLLWDRLVEPLFLSHANKYDPDTFFEDKVRILNTHMWTMLAPPSSCLPTNKELHEKDRTNAADEICSIRFVAGQTPVIFDPMSILVYGFASCTGLAILFVQALRAAGVPARVAGTPSWHQNDADGNHNWIEVHNNHDNRVTEDPWSFLEPSPAQEIIDTMERNPCERWFCNEYYTRNGTQFFAAQLSPLETAGTFFPLAWEGSNVDIPAENRTDYYEQICSRCGLDVAPDREDDSEGTGRIQQDRS